MTFLEGVNRLLRISTVISGDDDDLDSFSESQHTASLEIAKIAIQATLSELVSMRLIPYEEVDGTITYVQDQRKYDLPADFIRFKGRAFMLELDSNDESANRTVQFYRGGEEALRQEILNYRNAAGTPHWFYTVNGTTKQVGFYPVPDSEAAGTKVRFAYEKSVTVTSAGDDLPFVDDQQAWAFIDMAQRRFEMMYSRGSTDPDLLSNLQGDPIYNSARATLIELLRFTTPAHRYGYEYA